jgi:hypothetical protein
MGKIYRWINLRREKATARVRAKEKTAKVRAKERLRTVQQQAPDCG